MAKKKINKLTVETLRHEEATRKNIPTAEHQSVMYDAEKNPIRVAYARLKYGRLWRIPEQHYRKKENE